MTSQLNKNNSEIDTPLKSRLYQLMNQEEKKFPFSFANRTGLSSSTFHGIWTKGNTSLQRRTAEKISKATGADIDWIHKGIGQPYPAQPDTSTPTVEIDAVSMDEVEYIPVSVWDDDTPLDDDEVEIPFYKDLQFACGNGASNLIMDGQETRKLRMGVRTMRRLGIRPVNAFAASTTDYSMSPTIEKGSTIYVDRGRTNIKDGKVFAIEWGDLHYCKRLYKAPNGGIRVHSDNSHEYPDVTLTADQLQDQAFKIIGWVWQWSNLESW